MNIIAKKIKFNYYEEILNQNKRFEIRKEDDCRYQNKDILILKEIDVNNEYTGRITICRITSLIRNYEGLNKDYVVFGIRIVESLDLKREEELWSRR